MSTPDSSPAHPRHALFSPRRLAAIAHNTLLELVRQKVFYFLLIFGLVLIGCSFFLGVLRSEEMQFQVLKDVSLGAMSVFTWMLAVLTTSMILPKETEDRTLYTLLAKPVPRFEYLLGKLLGVCTMLALSMAIMGVMFAVVLYLKEQITIATTLADFKISDPEQAGKTIAAIKAQTFTWSLLPAVAAIYCKAVVIAALTLMISTFATSWIFTIVISTAAYLIGHMTETARGYWLAGGGSWLAKGGMALVALLFPDLQMFDLADDILAGNAIPLPMFLNTLGMGGFYVAIYFCLAYLVFSKKEL